VKIASLAFLVVTALLFFLQFKPTIQKGQVQPNPIISPTKPLSPPISTETLSGDGTMKATMKSQENLDGSTVYSLFISDSSGKNSKNLYSKTVQKGSIELPINSWSPDDKYLFVLDKEAGDNYLVFKSNGEPFISGDKFIDATSLFKKKQPGFSLSEVTGWDGVGLMHVKATNASFWFDIDSQNFLQLAR